MYEDLLENKKLSPMMRQYILTKQQHEDCLIFFRVGDFYELFFDDAVNTSKELDIALTGKDCGLDERAPMCGVPFHAVDIYISKLMQKGHKVAIVEQVENPSEAQGIVKREVAKIVTPGTVLYNDALNEGKNNYLFSIYYDANGYGLSIVDFSVGSFQITHIKNINSLIDLIDKFLPKEIIVNNLIFMSSLNMETIKNKYNISFTILDNDYYDEKHVRENEYLSLLLKNVRMKSRVNIERARETSPLHSKDGFTPALKNNLAPTGSNDDVNIERARETSPLHSKDGFVPTLKNNFAPTGSNDDVNIERAREIRPYTASTPKNSFAPMGAGDMQNCYYSAIATYEYLRRSQKADPKNIQSIEYFYPDEFMIMDNATIRNLELLETLQGRDKIGSLLNVLDYTKTAMGKRMLRNWIIEPLRDKKQIEDRQNAIKSLVDDTSKIGILEDYLFEIYDLERLSTRIIMKSANPRDLLQLKNSLKVLPEIKRIISNMDGDLFAEINNNFDTLNDIYELIDKAIKDEAPIVLRDGNIIKDGYDVNVDRLRESKVSGKNWLVELETKEREKTKIKNLKIKHSRVFGYLFEISNVYKGEIPDYFVRKQTLASAERYTTKELDELQNMIMNSEEKLKIMEYELFLKVVEFITDNKDRLKNVAMKISIIDTLNSLANCAIKRHYVCPSINEKGIINIKNGRHPVIESLQVGEEFIPNDTDLNNKKYIDIITGPNMAGKSTYMRQVALITLLAHMGSFVPCDKADITLVDRIFTRVGASDDLSRGRSTFMVEMTEVANILNNATQKSLVILDEIGRGTSTYDGLAIAWSIVEYISEKIKSKTLFATHYHELTDLEGKVEGVTNYNIAILEKDDDIIFLRKIVEGSAKKSYGIAVAKLAGIDEKVIKRANIILDKLHKEEQTEPLKEL